MPSSTIVASANIAIQAVLESSEASEAAFDSSLALKSRGPHLHLTPTQKFNIGKGPVKMD